MTKNELLKDVARYVMTTKLDAENTTLLISYNQFHKFRDRFDTYTKYATANSCKHKI